MTKLGPQHVFKTKLAYFIEEIFLRLIKIIQKLRIFKSFTFLGTSLFNYSATYLNKMALQNLQ